MTYKTRGRIVDAMTGSKSQTASKNKGKLRQGEGVSEDDAKDEVACSGVVNRMSAVFDPKPVDRTEAGAKPKKSIKP